jgi:hypothetical protein
VLSGGDECDGGRPASSLSGSATYYRLFDVGYAIDLDRAARLLGGSTRGRTRPTRLEARAFEIRNPPLLATLDAFDLDVAGQHHRVNVSAHVFDFGVCSLHLGVDAPRNVEWSEFVNFCEAVDRSIALGPAFEQALLDLTARLGASIDRPAPAPIVEDYRVYRVNRAGGLTDEQIATLLLGERRAISATARRELMPHRFSYYEDDLVVLTWEAALVVEPREEDRDVDFVLEFANAQLLELRLFDHQLDADLPTLHDRVEAARAGRNPRLASRFRAVLSDLQTRVADITETAERVENAIKVTNDVYLARVYAASLDLFREQAWRRGIDRKLGILRETYAMLNGEAQTARAELLEIAIVLLILIELVLGLLR